MDNKSPATVLVVLAVPLDEVVHTWLASSFAGRQVVVAQLVEEPARWTPPANWTVWQRKDIEDLEGLRRDFFAFLEAWPERRQGDRTFDEQLRTFDDYSLWWTGPGLRRHPDHGVFTKMRIVHAASRAIDRAAATEVVVIADSRTAAAICGKALRRGCTVTTPPGAVAPLHAAPAGRLRFAVTAVARFLAQPLSFTLRAAICRWRMGMPKNEGSGRSRPSIVMTALFPREFRERNGEAEVAFWSEVAAALRAQAPGVQPRFLLHTKGDALGRGIDLFGGHRAWPEIRRIRGATPLAEMYPGWRVWLASFFPFLLLLYRYCRLERTAAFRESFRFADCDVAALYVPLLRDAVAKQPLWARAVAAFAWTLRKTGGVKAVLAYGEFYGFGQMMIAAARRLGIPTIGVQHGTIFPMHLVYTLPAGQIAGAPVPDFFAAYGEQSREIVCELGRYSRARVWIVGGPRFDVLATSPPDGRVARRLLDLPHDKTIVLLATQNYPWFQAAARALFEAIGKRPDCLICIKTHPSDVPLDVYRRLADEAGATHVRFYSDRFDDLLAACDVLASGSSTALFEAILLGRRAICLNFSDEPDRYPYVSDGGALGARSEEEVTAALNAALDPARQAALAADRTRFLERHAGPSAQGRSAETLVTRILEMIEQHDVKADLRPAPEFQHPLKHGSTEGTEKCRLEDK